MTRVRVFVDYQNLYHGARETFHGRHAHPTFGHVRLLRLGGMVRLMGESRDPNRDLDRIEVFRGEPTTKSHPRLQASFQRQVAQWRSEPLLRVHTRPLRYEPTRWDGQGRPCAWDPGREKGIDVLIALAMVLGAVRDEYDTAILISGDTDLVPAIDATLEAGKSVENAVWWPSQGHGHPLRASGSQRIWCHRLDERCFNSVRDDTDYTT